MKNLKERIEGVKGGLNYSELLSIVSRETFIPEREILGRSRNIEIASARHVFAWLAMKKIQGANLTKVGEFLGDRGHDTIINSINRVDNAIETNYKRILNPLERVVSLIEGLQLNSKEMGKKTVNELLLELQDARIITEGHKLLILRAIKRERDEAIQEKEEEIKKLEETNSELLEEVFELRDECRQQA